MLPSARESGKRDATDVVPLLEDNNIPALSDILRQIEWGLVRVEPCSSRTDHGNEFGSRWIIVLDMAWAAPNRYELEKRLATAEKVEEA